MNPGHYYLAKQSGGIGQLAEVSVETRPTDDSTSIAVSPEAFGWLKELYGPNAWEWSVCDDYRDAAIAGCRYAIANRKNEDSTPLDIRISKIKGHPAHTTWEAVAFAACFAVWNALADEGRNKPEFTHGKFTNLPKQTRSEQGGGGNAHELHSHPSSAPPEARATP